MPRCIASPSMPSPSAPNHSNSSSKNEIVGGSKCMQNNSMTSQFSECQLETQKEVCESSEEERLIYKICDAVYIGTQLSIWDVYTMEANYITHLIRVESGHSPNPQYKSSHTNSQSKNQQNYVPQVVSHVHRVNYHQIIQQKGQPLFENLTKLIKFIEHAHQEGQSCIIISSPQHTQRQKNGSTHWQLLYSPSTLVSAYLMFKYKWGMLKSIQYMQHRLTANIQNQIRLTSMSGKTNNSIRQGMSSDMKLSIEKQKLYSQMLKRKEERMVAPNMGKISTDLLNNLQQQLMASSSTLSYGWSTNQKQQHSSAQLVITNTFLNSSAGQTIKQNKFDSKNYIKVLKSGVNSNRNQSKQNRSRHSASMGSIKSYQKTAIKIKKVNWNVNNLVSFKDYYENEPIAVCKIERSSVSGMDSANKRDSLFYAEVNQYRDRMMKEYNNKTHDVSTTTPIPTSRSSQTTLMQGAKNKITLNVINIIQSQPKKVTSLSKSLINKKSINNQSKAKLPTIHDLVGTRCNTVSNMEDMEDKYNSKIREKDQKRMRLGTEIVVSEENERNSGTMKIKQKVSVLKKGDRFYDSKRQNELGKQNLSIQSIGNKQSFEQISPALALKNKIIEETVSKMKEMKSSMVDPFRNKSASLTLRNSVILNDS